jgi:hypothetical protein
MVSRMDANRLVHLDWTVFESLEVDGIKPFGAADLLTWLVDKALLDRDADDYYRVTADGFDSVPAEARPRIERKERTMEQKLTDIETREADRLRLLDAVYEMTEGNTTRLCVDG